jgi:hypothetical protein
MVDPAIVGAWVKEPAPACAAPYPAELIIRPKGLYEGCAETRGEYTRWDLGSWRIVGPDRIELSTATDKVIAYAFTLDGDRLAFEDPDGCRFGYRRASASG